MLQAPAGLIPAFTAERTTQSMPNMKRSSASRSSVHTQTRFVLAPSSVTALMAWGREFHGVLRVAAAKEHPNAVLEEVIRYVPVDRLVGVGDAGGGACGDEFAAVDVARDGPAAAQRLGEHGVAPAVAHRHLHEVHLLAEGDGLGPAVEDPADLRRRQVAARRSRTGARSRGPCSGP